MLSPLELEGPLSARLNQQEPLELHWRKNPPTCRGNIEKAYYRAYPDLVHKTLCFQCGAVPCPYNHDESDKKQRLVDMEFVKELAKERREMKEELRRLRAKVENYEKLEDTWNTSRKELEAEIRRLKLTNEQNQDYMNEMRREQQRMKALSDEVDALTDANRRLQQENELYNRRLTSQASEISELMRENKHLTEELDKARSKTKKLMVEVQESKDALKKVTKQLAEREAKIMEMEHKVKNLVQELTEKTKEYQQKEVEFETLVKQLKGMIEGLKEAQKELEGKNKDLTDLVNSLQREIEMLKKKLASDTRFRQFVEIKRECNVLKDMSGNLAQKVQNFENKRPLPTVKKSGRVSRRSSAFGPGARPPQSILSRPKETKVPVRPLEFESGQDDGEELANLADFDDESRPSTSQLMRPKSAMSSPYRSPTAASFAEDGDYYDEASGTMGIRPGSGLHRSKSARFKKAAPNVDHGSPSWSRTPSRMSSGSPSLKVRSENMNGDVMTEYMNEDTLPVTIDDLNNQRNCESRLTCTPNSSYVGSDFEFAPLEI